MTYPKKGFRHLRCRRRRLVVRRRHRDVYETGNVGCRTIIVKKEDDFGRMVTKRIRKCAD